VSRYQKGKTSLESLDLILGRSPGTDLGEGEGWSSDPCLGLGSGSEIGSDLSPDM